MTGQQRGILRSAMKVMKAMKVAQATAPRKVKDQGRVAAAEKINYSKHAKTLKREREREREYRPNLEWFP